MYLYSDSGISRRSGGCCDFSHRCEGVQAQAAGGYESQLLPDWLEHLLQQGDCLGEGPGHCQPGS